MSNVLLDDRLHRSLPFNHQERKVAFAQCNDYVALLLINTCLYMSGFRMLNEHTQHSAGDYWVQNDNFRNAWAARAWSRKVSHRDAKC